MTLYVLKMQINSIILLPLILPGVFPFNEISCILVYFIHFSSCLVFHFFFPFIFVSWRLITLQYCSGFCHKLTRISHGFTCVPHGVPFHEYLLIYYSVLPFEDIQIVSILFCFVSIDIVQMSIFTHFSWGSTCKILSEIDLQVAVLAHACSFLHFTGHC